MERLQELLAVLHLHVVNQCLLAEESVGIHPLLLNHFIIWRLYFLNQLQVHVFALALLLEVFRLLSTLLLEGTLLFAQNLRLRPLHAVVLLLLALYLLLWAPNLLLLIHLLESLLQLVLFSIGNVLLLVLAIHHRCLLLRLLSHIRDKTWRMDLLQVFILISFLPFLLELFNLIAIEGALTQLLINAESSLFIAFLLLSPDKSWFRPFVLFKWTLGFCCFLWFSFLFFVLLLIFWVVDVQVLLQLIEVVIRSLFFGIIQVPIALHLDLHVRLQKVLIQRILVAINYLLLSKLRMFILSFFLLYRILNLFAFLRGFVGSDKIVSWMLWGAELLLSSGSQRKVLTDHTEPAVQI